MISRHERVRQGGCVKRFHARPTIGAQSVAEHSWGVAAILWEICEPSDALVKAALFHDLAEYDTGDTPFTAKRLSPQLKTALVTLEESIDKDIGMMPHLENEELFYLKMADMLELCWYAVDQRRLGNLGSVEWYVNGMAFVNDTLNATPYYTARVRETYNDIATAWSLT